MSVDGRGGGGGGAMWMVEVTKNKEASKEVLMRAILDLRSVPSPASRSSPVLKLVYVMTELQDARSLNGASEEEVFRQEAAWEMSKRNAESLLRSFLTMAQQRNVPVSACVERCSEREHGLCTATRRFQAERLYVAARKKLFSKAVPAWLLDCQAGVPPSCLVVAVQGEKKLYELMGTGSSSSTDLQLEGSASAPAGTGTSAGGLSASRLQEHQQQYQMQTHQQAEQLQQPGYQQYSHAPQFVQYQQQGPSPGIGGANAHPSYGYPQQQAAEQEAFSGHGSSASRFSDRGGSGALPGFGQGGPSLQGETSTSYPGQGAPLPGPGGHSGRAVGVSRAGDVNGGNGPMGLPPDNSGAGWAGPAPSRPSPLQGHPPAIPKAATGEDGSVGAQATSALASSAALVEQQIGMLSQAVGGMGQTEQLQEQLRQVLALQQQIQQQLQAASAQGGAGPAGNRSLSMNTSPVQSVQQQHQQHQQHLQTQTGGTPFNVPAKFSGGFPPAAGSQSTGSLVQRSSSDVPPGHPVALRPTEGGAGHLAGLRQPSGGMGSRGTMEGDSEDGRASWDSSSTMSAQYSLEMAMRTSGAMPAGGGMSGPQQAALPVAALGSSRSGALPLRMGATGAVSPGDGDASARTARSMSTSNVGGAHAHAGGGGMGPEVKFVRREREGWGAKKGQGMGMGMGMGGESGTLEALEEDEGEESGDAATDSVRRTADRGRGKGGAGHGERDSQGGARRTGGTSSLADELAALEDDDEKAEVGEGRESLSRANKWAASVLSMGKSVSSNRFPESNSGLLPGTGHENRSGAQPTSSETWRSSLQARAGAASGTLAPGGTGGVGFSQGAAMSVGARRGAGGALSQGGALSPRAPLGPEFFECRKFTPQQLQRATRSYAPENLLGKGSFGAVFKGELLGCQVAVKKLEGSGWQGPEEFHMEVEVLSKMRHPNIVLLMGCCTEEMSLIYEFLPGGTLHDKLGPPKTADAQPLAWSDRIRICAEMASALLYLHQNDPPIVHRDLKPDNILLDGHLMSKIGDVGLARLLVDEENMTIKVRGTAGYIDPEEVETCEISVASDIYAFGLIMLQLLTGQRYVKNVHRMLAEAWKGGNTDMGVATATVLKYLDNTGGEWPPQLARDVAELALGASQRRRELRPDLADSIHPRFMVVAKRAEEEVRRRKKEADSQFICPLSKELMKDPVVAADGFTYEREHISKWMATCNLSPSTGLPLAHTALTPNNVLKNLILSSVTR